MASWAPIDQPASVLPEARRAATSSAAVKESQQATVKLLEGNRKVEVEDLSADLGSYLAAKQQEQQASSATANTGLARKPKAKMLDDIRQALVNSKELFDALIAMSKQDSMHPTLRKLVFDLMSLIFPAPVKTRAPFTPAAEEPKFKLLLKPGPIKRAAPG